MRARLTLNLSMVEPSWLLPLARDAEELGFEAVSVGDSIFYPRRSDSRYPYTDDGDRSFIEGRPFLDPIVAGAAVLTGTSTLVFQTSVLKLGVRHPLLVAKQVASLAALAPGRVRLGVGTSPWPEDFSVLGVPFEGRGRRLDEAIGVLRAVLQGGYQSFEGAVYDVPELRIDPAPPKPVPVLVGGHGPASLRRAAALADGWIAARTEPGRLPELIDAVQEHRGRCGRGDEPFSIHAPIHGSPDQLDTLLEAGVSHVTVRAQVAGAPPADLADARTSLRRLADALR